MHSIRKASDRAGQLAAPALAGRLKWEASGNQKVPGRDLGKQHNEAVHKHTGPSMPGLCAMELVLTDSRRLRGVSRQTDRYSGRRLGTGWHTQDGLHGSTKKRRAAAGTTARTRWWALAV